MCVYIYIYIIDYVHTMPLCIHGHLCASSHVATEHLQEMKGLVSRNFTEALAKHLANVGVRIFICEYFSAKYGSF